VTKSERGIAVKVMAVVRTFMRKKNKTMKTKRLPSRKASLTLFVAASMK